MSRSNPNSETTPNPATKWIDWSGSKGTLSYYDKATKETVTIGEKFSFLLLDSLSCVRGWHDPSESGIYSNEVRDTRAEEMTVKAFKGGILAKGLYTDIKDRVKASGGKFNTNLYIACKKNDELVLCALTLSGAALMAWMEFSKNNRKALNEKAVVINGSAEGKKGSIVFKTPKFSLMDVSEKMNEQAVKLDEEILQPYLKAYLAKNKSEGTDEFSQARREQSDEWNQAEAVGRAQEAGDTGLRNYANKDSQGDPWPEERGTTTEPDEVDGLF